MPTITNVVVLMLENRSFDSMLGWLYESGAPSQFIGGPADDNVYDGLQPANVNPANFVNVATLSSGQISCQPGLTQTYTAPSVDPGEEFENVNIQLFNNGQYVPPANMLGYLQDYANVLNGKSYDDNIITAQAPEVMQSYAPAQLPVLNQLAQAYAVSDAWYSSVPSQTNPNRAFLMCGTSLGLVNNGQLETNPQAQQLESLLGMAIGDDSFNAPTIFNALADAGVSWGVYWQTSYLPHKISTFLEYAEKLAIVIGIATPVGAAIIAALAALTPYMEYLASLSDGTLGSCYTWRLFPQIQNIANAEANFFPLDGFYEAAAAGTLPSFSYIEPYWTISQTTAPGAALQSLPQALVTTLGNDYHPPCNLLAAEKLVKDVYQALIAGPNWQNTMLVITFDEPVGSFDHEATGLAEGLVQAPWGDQPPPQLAVNNNFYFDRLGGRVPAIVVSPWVQAGTVFRSNTAVPFDHTSVIATTLNLLNAPGQLAQFGQRAANAPTFDTVLTLPAARTDAASLAFVDKIAQPGSPVCYGDSLQLQDGPSGAYLAAAVQAFKATPLRVPEGLMGMCVDIGLAAWFPTLQAQANAISISFVSPAPTAAGQAIGAVQVQDGDQVYLISRESSLGAANALGAWSDSYDCYYYTPDFEAPGSSTNYGPNQTWTIHNASSPGQPITYGCQVTLTNNNFGTGLAQDGRWFMGSWITTSGNGDAWTVTPLPSLS